MSYAVTMDAEGIVCSIPLSDLGTLAKEFYGVTVIEKDVELTQYWEEDDCAITGMISGNNIVLNGEQHGTFKNSSDGGLSYLLNKYKGSGTIETVGEDGADHEISKYKNGTERKGRIVFDDDEDGEPDDLKDELSLEDDEDAEDEDPYEHDYGDEDDEEYDEETEKEDAKTIQESGILEYIGTLNGMLLEAQERPFKPQIKVEKSGEKKQEKPSKPSRFDNII